MNDLRDRKDMLLEAGLTLASELSLPIVLQRIVDLAAQVTDARYGALGVIGKEETLIEFVTTGIGARQRQAIGALPTGRGVLGLLIREPRPVRIRNIADHPMSVGFPPNHPPMHSFLGVPVQALGRVFGNIYLAEKRGGDEFTAADEEALVILATQAGVAIANASLYEEVRSRERWLDALRDITTNVLSGSTEASLLQQIADHARELAGADTATIVTPAAAGEGLVVAAASGTGSSELRGQPLPADASLSGLVMRTGESLIFDDLGSETQGFQPLIDLARLGPSVLVPLRTPVGVAGTLAVANVRGGKHFSIQTRRLVESLADAASVAIDYDRAQSELNRLGLMEERERIAKELHDGIIQSLFAVGMGLQGTALLAGSAETSARIEKAVEELDRVIRDLRNYIFGLRPGILADRQLDQALRQLGQEMQSRSRESVDVSVDAALAAALSNRSADIVQLTREALSNVARHAQATRASVRLERKGSAAVLTVEDDGVGFAPAGPTTGNGMRNMRERAARLGGTLDVASANGKGTVLRITFPV
jgi:two-component system, NarL family, sensor histidine kinase DevS